MSVRYYDRAGWGSDLSDECSPNGNGQCDGYDEDGTECECRCHDLDIPSIHTVKQVERLHHLGWIFEGWNYASPRSPEMHIVYKHPEA